VVVRPSCAFDIDFGAGGLSSEAGASPALDRGNQ
jgi:hypothetical protein